MANPFKLLFVAYALLVSYVSLRSPTGLPSTFLYTDSLIHFGMYGAFVVIGLVASTGRTPAIYIVAGTVFFGVMQELIQPSFGRSFEIGDILANTAGAVCGYVGVTIARYFRSLSRRRL